MKLEILKDTIESCNVNFLIGSGLSRPYLITLGNIENLLDELEKDSSIGVSEKDVIKCSLYKIYFEGVMIKNLDLYKKIDDDEKNYTEVISNYKNFVQFLNEILLYRYNTLLNKQINIFTTNIDLFFEKALEETMIEFNDGFKGRLNPIFNLSNFQKSYRKTSLHYKNTSEIPVFNLLKVHGSINWKKEKEKIILSSFKEIERVQETIKDMPLNTFISVSNGSKLKGLVEDAKTKITTVDAKKMQAFSDAYEQLQIVNPTKEKFKSTLLNTYYYELLRMFANEMEKENTILFVMGFSFADEHIREITIRAVNSNPTLQLFIIAFDENAKKELKVALKFDSCSILNNNVHIIDPADFCTANSEDTFVTKFELFDFASINKMVFLPIKERSNPMIAKYEK